MNGTTNMNAVVPKSCETSSNENDARPAAPLAVSSSLRATISAIRRPMIPYVYVRV
jgi:hypothetical protein